jgi:hypothetical protein
MINHQAESIGELLVKIATQVRRYKSIHKLPLGTSIKRLELVTSDGISAGQLAKGIPDLKSITRVLRIDITNAERQNQDAFYHDEQITIKIIP